MKHAVIYIYIYSCGGKDQGMKHAVIYIYIYIVVVSFISSSLWDRCDLLKKNTPHIM